MRTARFRNRTFPLQERPGGWQVRQWPLVRFASYVRPHALLFGAAAFMGLWKFTLPLLFPLSYKYVVDVLLIPQPNWSDHFNVVTDRFCLWFAPLLGLDTSPRGKLIAITAAMAIVYVAQAAVSYFRDYWAGIAGNRLIFDLRTQLYNHLQRLSCSFFDTQRSGALVSRVVNDVDRAQELVGTSLVDIWTQVGSFGVVVALLFALDWRLALVSTGVIPFYVAMVSFFSPRIKRASHGVQETIETYVGELQERVSGIATIKAFRREASESGRFAAHMLVLLDRAIQKIWLAAQEQMLSEFITRITPSVIVLIAAFLIMRHAMTVGTLIAFIGLIGYIYQPLQRFAELSVVIATSQAAIERIFELLDTAPGIKEHALAQPLHLKRGTIKFDHVSFAYNAPENGEHQNILHDIDLHIEGGSRIALVGRSGAGKTTMACLIPRLYDVTSGRLMIDGRDVRRVTLASLRMQIGIVTQETMLFSAPIREVLRYGRPDADERAMWDALERANIRHTIERLPDRLNTVIGPHGVKFSTGQRQRLALARAFLKDPAILILDEATAAVDTESENLIHEAMNRLMENRTAILIAHRLRSAVDADQIVAIEDGRLAEAGTHRQLLRSGGIYARLFREQTNGLGLNGSATHGIRSVDSPAD